MIDTWRTYLGELSARQLALIGAALLLAVSGTALLWTDEPETVVTLREETSPPPAPEIAGLSAAAQKIRSAHVHFAVKAEKSQARDPSRA